MTNNPPHEILVLLGVLLTAMMPVWIMYGAIRKFVDSKSEGDAPPTIFGRFRRNVVSYEETVLYYSIFLFGSFSVFVIFLIDDSYFNGLVIFTLAMFFSLSLAIAINSFRNPFLFRPKTKVSPQNDVSVFYVRVPEVSPRRDFIPPPAPAPAPIPRIIFVQPANNIEAV